jgi:HK97 family phage portal protein
VTLRIYSGGELVDEPWPWVGDWHMFSGNVQDFQFDTQTLLDPITVWRTQRAVRTVVGFLARNYAQVRMHGYERADDGPARLYDGPLADLLGRPDINVTPYAFAHEQLIDLSLYDRWAALKVSDEEGGLRLVRIPPRLWRYMRDRFDRPTAVRVFGMDDTQYTRYIDIDLERFAWLDGYPVGDSLYSPMEQLVDLLAEETASTKARFNLWERGARLSGWIERPDEAPEWTPKARANFQTKFRSAYTGDGTGAGGVPLLEEGMKFHPVDQVTPRQAEQIEARKLTTAEVAAAFHVAPVLVGVLDNSNYSNVVAYRQILYSDTLGPLFQQTGQAFNAQVLPDVADAATHYAEHNVGEKLRLSFEEQAKVLQSAVGAPFMTRNEARQRMNLSTLEGADELIVPLNVLEGGQASPNDTDTSGDRP